MHDAVHDAVRDAGASRALIVRRSTRPLAIVSLSSLFLCDAYTVHIGLPIRLAHMVVVRFLCAGRPSKNLAAHKAREWCYNAHRSANLLLLTTRLSLITFQCVRVCFRTRDALRRYYIIHIVLFCAIHITLSALLLALFILFCSSVTVHRITRLCLSLVLSCARQIDLIDLIHAHSRAIPAKQATL